MFKALAYALAVYNIPEDQIRLILDRLSQANLEAYPNPLWNTFCQSCLELGLDPQAIFALAATENLLQESALLPPELQ